jgi:hypothetical protein
MSDETVEAEKETVLTMFLRVLDRFEAGPIFAEVCACGGEICIGRDMPSAERRRMTGAFMARHRNCMTAPIGQENEG